MAAALAAGAFGAMQALEARGDQIAGLVPDVSGIDLGPILPPATTSLAGEEDTAAPSDLATGTQPYEVQPGDALWKIAAAFGTTLQALMELNGLEDADRLDVGQVILVPAPSEAP